MALFCSAPMKPLFHLTAEVMVHSKLDRKIYPKLKKTFLCANSTSLKRVKVSVILLPL